MKKDKMLSKMMLGAVAIIVSVVVLGQPIASAATDNAVAVTAQKADNQQVENISSDVSNAIQTAEVEIEDEEIPLATLEEQQRMSWWWLLLVLVLGTTCAELFRRYQLKREASKKK